MIERIFSAFHIFKNRFWNSVSTFTRIVCSLIKLVVKWIYAFTFVCAFDRQIYLNVSQIDFFSVHIPVVVDNKLFNVSHRWNATRWTTNSICVMCFYSDWKFKNIESSDLRLLFFYWNKSQNKIQIEEKKTTFNHMTYK